MEEILIEKVKEHEVIYNVESPDYRDQCTRQAAWEEIGKDLKIPATTAKECWDKLRRCFCNARNRRRNKKINGIVSRKNYFWKYEQQMEFLAPFIESRKTQSKFLESHTSLNPFNETENIKSVGSDAEGITLFPMEHYNLDAENEKNSISGDNDRSRYEEKKTVQNKKRRKSIPELSYEFAQSLKENSDSRSCQYEDKGRTTTPSKTTNSFETLDDTDMFFLSMSRMTKQLPKVDQAQIKLALSNSVLSSEIRNQQLLCLPSNTHYSIHSAQQNHCSSTL